ncbi:MULTISPECIES: hypothetical protein [Paracoccaceae]
MDELKEHSLGVPFIPIKRETRGGPMVIGKITLTAQLHLSVVA